jgi:hypothetical protein
MQINSCKPVQSALCHPSECPSDPKPVFRSDEIHFARNLIPCSRDSYSLFRRFEFPVSPFQIPCSAEQGICPETHAIPRLRRPIRAHSCARKSTNSLLISRNSLLISRKQGISAKNGRSPVTARVLDRTPFVVRRRRNRRLRGCLEPLAPRRALRDGNSACSFIASSGRTVWVRFRAARSN